MISLINGDIWQQELKNINREKYGDQIKMDVSYHEEQNQNQAYNNQQSDQLSQHEKDMKKSGQRLGKHGSESKKWWTIS